MPLRRLLPIVTAALVALALLVAGALATTALRSYLVGQIDTSLLRTPPEVPLPPPTPASGPTLPSTRVIEVLDPSGASLTRISNLDQGTAEPELPALSRAETAATNGAPFTYQGWRVLARPLPDGSTLVVAESLSEVNAIVNRLVWLQVGLGCVTLLAVGALSTLVVRRSLRPLQQVENTALAISGGDLTTRVSAPVPGTEAGGVGIALNSMLDRLQTSFEQRQQALDAAHASEARMRQFVADASHELRTPLTGVRGTAELYRQGAVPDADVAGAFERIEVESERMGLLVDELLLLARLDAERPLAREPVDLLEVCSAAVRNFGPEVRLSVLPGSAAPIVWGDPARLRQVVDNLIGNGLQHGEGVVTVTVGTLTEQAIVQVADEGPGVPAVDAQRVFDRFYRSQGDRSRASGGTGLGLSIVAALVSAHGGTVSVAGAQFQVRLPLADPDSGASSPSS